MAENDPNEDGERGVIINTASVAAFEGQVCVLSLLFENGAFCVVSLFCLPQLSAADRAGGVLVLEGGHRCTDVAGSPGAGQQWHPGQHYSSRFAVAFPYFL